MTHKQNKKQLIEMEPKMTEIMEFINKDLKTSITNLTNMLKDFKRSINLMRKEGRYIYICFKDPNKTSRD